MSAEISLFVPEPQAPCKTCVENARHQDKVAGIVWCQHTRYGGVYQIEIGQWSLVGPFEDEACFKRSLYASFARQLLMLPAPQLLLQFNCRRKQRRGYIPPSV